MGRLVLRLTEGSRSWGRVGFNSRVNFSLLIDLLQMLGSFAEVDVKLPISWTFHLNLHTDGKTLYHLRKRCQVHELDYKNDAKMWTLNALFICYLFKKM